jgi:hypothetical protein
MKQFLYFATGFIIGGFFAMSIMALFMAGKDIENRIKEKDECGNSSL